MDLDSQLSEIKEVDYNSSYSKNSGNNIYQKETINEKNKANINNFRNLNYENIATNKMQYINFNIINNYIIRLKDVLKSNNELSKYIQYAKEYNNSSNIKIDLNDKKYNKAKAKLILNKNRIFVHKKVPENIRKEVIDFSHKKCKKNFYYTRMSNIEKKRINLNVTDKIIMIQKHIRGFLSKKIIYAMINHEITKNIINSVLMIQRHFRKFLSKKNKLDNYIIRIITKERNDKANKIIRLFSLYHNRNLFVKNLLIKKIVITRYYSAQFIQSTFKSYLLRRKVLYILKKEKKSYVLEYPFEAENVKIKIFTEGKNGKSKICEYFKCPIRKYFVAYIDKKGIKPGEYLCQMIVNNNIILDKRYKCDKKDGFYNLIPIGIYKNKIPKHIKNAINNNKPKDLDKKINEEFNNFYFYYYNNEEDEKETDNDLSHSQNSDNSQNERKYSKDNYLNQIDENDPDQVIDISKTRYNDKFNNIYIKSNYKYIKEYKNKKEEKEQYEKSFKNIYDNLFSRSQNDEKDNDSAHNSEYLKYNYILDELNHSVKSFNSNISMKNLDSYSKKTHKTKFKKTDISKKKNSNKNKKKK